MKYDNSSFENKFYYEHLRPTEPYELISLANGFLRSAELSPQRRAAAGVVGVYKSIEHNYLSELKNFYENLSKIIGDISETAFSETLVNGARDDSKQVLISVYTVLWQAEVLLSRNVERHVSRLMNAIDRFPYIKVSYSQNVARSVSVLAYFYFSKGEYAKSLACIEWFENFYFRISDDMKRFKTLGSSPCGDLLKTVGLLQVCMAGKEWMMGKRIRENLWGPRKLLTLCPRVKKGLSKNFDRSFLELLAG